jgi:hypothetical protein
MSASPEAREWRRVIAGAVRECLETWRLQAKAGPVTAEALKAILARSSVLLLRRLEGQSPELVVALLPILIRSMLAAFVEVMAEQRASKA